MLKLLGDDSADRYAGQRDFTWFGLALNTSLKVKKETTMATYFSGSDDQKDSSPMHYSKEPLPNSYSEVPGNMMMYMNYASSSGSYSDTLAGNLQQPDITPVAEPDSNSSQQQILSNIGGSRIGLHDFNSWKDGRNEMVLMQQPEGSAAGAQILQGQGLSLSLGTQVSPGFQIYRDHNSGFSSFLGGSSQLISGDNDDTQSRQSRNVEYTPHGFPGTNLDAKTYMTQYGMSSIARTLSNSKYLKAAQQLLDEVVNVRIAVKDRNSKKELSKDRKEMDAASKDGSSDPPQESSSNCHELSSAEKQDLQNKLTKLLSMLDEVDSRYKQYYHQMQLVVSSFDGVAGTGAAKPYTALALQTISRHFRCLRDAINGQIVVTRRSLGEQDATSNSKGLGISRLRYVDQQLRQQRALQQLGMMQQHAWRPQRGLPENAVTILRAWLFEHFLHPYPKDSDKIMLARQTGLTRGQVSNWFINARVRLWKPMVEEMYKEETGDAEMDPSSSSAEMVPQATKSNTKVSEDRVEDVQQSETSTAMEQCFNAQFVQSKSDHKRDTEIGGSNSKAVFQNITHTEDQRRPIVDGSPIFPGTIGQSHESSDRFVAVGNDSYHMTELERFGNGNRNGVSLTLGLQHCDGGNHPMSLEDHHNFVTMRGDNVYNPAPSSMGSEAADFDCLESGNRQHRFGSSHLFHDFVA